MSPQCTATPYMQRGLIKIVIVIDIYSIIAEFIKMYYLSICLLFIAILPYYC